MKLANGSSPKRRGKFEVKWKDADVRPPILADRPGTILKRDNEYVRHGTANIFCVVEPKVGRHLTTVTPNRKGSEFAKLMGRLARAYPAAETIHLVMDNLNTHAEKSLIGFYGQRRGTEIWNKFTPHFTPKHGSWLNQAEIEGSLLSRTGLGHDRFGEYDLLKLRVSAWDDRMNIEQVKIDWRFNVEDARRKFGYGRHRSRNRRLDGHPVAFGLRRRRSSLACPSGTPRSSLLGSLQNQPAEAGVIRRSED